jgi:hypothetical protein
MPGTAATAAGSPRRTSSGVIGRPNTLFTFVPAPFAHGGVPGSHSTSLQERLKSGLSSDKGSYFGIYEPTPAIAPHTAASTHVNTAKILPVEQRRSQQRKNSRDNSPRSPRRASKRADSREKLSADDALVSAWNAKMAQGALWPEVFNPDKTKLCLRAPAGPRMVNVVTEKDRRKDLPQPSTATVQTTYSDLHEALAVARQKYHAERRINEEILKRILDDASSTVSGAPRKRVVEPDVDEELHDYPTTFWQKRHFHLSTKDNLSCKLTGPSPPTEKDFTEVWSGVQTAYNTLKNVHKVIQLEACGYPDHPGKDVGIKAETEAEAESVPALSKSWTETISVKLQQEVKPHLVCEKSEFSPRETLEIYTGLSSPTMLAKPRLVGQCSKDIEAALAAEGILVENVYTEQVDHAGTQIRSRESILLIDKQSSMSTSLQRYPGTKSHLLRQLVRPRRRKMSAWMSCLSYLYPHLFQRKCQFPAQELALCQYRLHYCHHQCPCAEGEAFSWTKKTKRSFQILFPRSCWYR